MAQPKNTLPYEPIDDSINGGTVDDGGGGITATYSLPGYTPPSQLSFPSKNDFNDFTSQYCCPYANRYTEY